MAAYPETTTETNPKGIRTFWLKNKRCHRSMSVLFTANSEVFQNHQSYREHARHKPAASLFENLLIGQHPGVEACVDGITEREHRECL